MKTSSSARPTSGSGSPAANFRKWYVFRKLESELYVAPEADRVLARFDEAARRRSSTGTCKVSGAPASLALRPSTKRTRAGKGSSIFTQVHRKSDRRSTLTLIMPSRSSEGWCNLGGS